MSYYYQTDPYQSYEEYDPQNGPYYPPAMHMPPPPFFQTPPPGQFYVPNMNSFPPQNYVQGGEFVNSELRPQSTGGNSYHENDEGKQNRPYSQQGSSKEYHTQSGRGQGYRRGQGHRGGHKHGYDRDQEKNYDRQFDHGHQRDAGYERSQRYEKGQGRGYGRGQGHGYKQGQGQRSEKGQRTERYGSPVQDKDHRHIRDGDFGEKHRENYYKEGKSSKFEKGKDKTSDGTSEIFHKKLKDVQRSRKSYESDGNLNVEKFDQNSHPTHKAEKAREISSNSQDTDSGVVERKSKAYSSDQDFFEKNFASFSKKSTNKPDVTEIDHWRGERGTKGHNERPKSGHQGSKHNQHHTEDQRKGQNKKGSKYDGSDQQKENTRNREEYQYGRDRADRKPNNPNKKDSRQGQRNSPRDHNAGKSESRKGRDYHDEGITQNTAHGSRKEFVPRTKEREHKNSNGESAESFTNQICQAVVEWDRRTMSDTMSEMSDDICFSGETRSNASDVEMPRRQDKDKSIHYKPMRKQNLLYQHQQQNQKGHGRKKQVLLRTASGKVDESQRALLIEQLTAGTYECMVCCDTIRGQNAVWSCNGCYHIFHLRCIKTWAKSPTARIEGLDQGWRCPACQNTSDKIPNQYRCFCGKCRDPEWNRMETPHSCGEVCKKNRSARCKHHCNILCHPGPCPPCNAVVTRQCLCGKQSQSMKCSSVEIFKCSSVCEKQLNCGKHFCKKICHEGPCDPCTEVIKQECYGSHESREVTCGSSESFTESYSCGIKCDKTLGCGNHKCEDTCHPGSCQSCTLLPEAITTCPCGARDLADLSPTPRQSCLEPIPTCGGKCRKPLKCGPPKKPHICERKCHEGPCGSCDLTTELTCRCTKFKKEFPCTEVMKLKDRVFLCERKCNKLRSCQRHKCGQHCCVSEDHACNLICGKKLPCGLHRCEEPCHRGNCPPCLMASFDELPCHCGAEIMYPPIPCGARPPECHQLCNRVHACDHDVQHRCHSDENCPPCTALTEKWCMGKHEKRKNIACHRDNISCGLPCNNELPCVQHKCTKVCHSGPCQAEGETCRQPCHKKRANCSHLCMTRCHANDPCPSISCKAEVKIKCSCGNRESMVTCQSLDNKEFKSKTMQSIATSLGAGQSVDISHLTSSKKAKKPNNVLECDAECALIERNRRLALALEIKNPDLGNKLGTPSFSDFLKDFAKKNLHFVGGVEKNFNDLVQNAKKAKQAYRSHSFPCMNRDQRRLIHELGECYGCETQSYDYEPSKNVVATAHKDKCWLPNVTLTSYIQRELHPKAPVPIPHRYNETTIRESALAAKHSCEVLKDKPIERVQRSNNTKETTPTSKVIDYFDFSTQ
nr:transcriptional repressor NF-X1 [Crassostrea gigas]XP_019928791.2 transcriptional repressor NF-X1 [Crassostrea gigas]XP_034309218.1 transcriptional repressor NF-X1 [Crassostrea gigas]